MTYEKTARHKHYGPHVLYRLRSTASARSTSSPEV
jgi:hypothetical protein